MARKKSDPFAQLSWNDLQRWAGSTIVGRGKSYQRQKLVSHLARLDNGGLIAWVDGTHRYATQVTIDEDGLPESVCTCPYEYDCKHGVAVVLEYLEQVKQKKKVPLAAGDDERLKLFDDERWDEGDDEFDEDDEDEDEEDEESTLTPKEKTDIAAFLKNKTKAQLGELIVELAGKFPGLAQELTDRQQLSSGDTKTLVNRLRNDIRKISSEPGWQDYWNHDGYTPDYSAIRKQFERLLEAGHQDQLLSLGAELIDLGIQQVEQSDDDGDTAMEIEDCVPILVRALEASSLSGVDKLAWAVDTVLKDDYDILNAFEDYLERKHAQADWSHLADRLLKRLKQAKSSNGPNDYHWKYARDRLIDWIIYALDQAGRENEVIPLCEAEVSKTGNYIRLVQYLISDKKHEDAERWIQEGIKKTENTEPGIASRLRNSLKEIRSSQKDWAAVAMMQAEEFVRYPSTESYAECQKATKKTKTWPAVRESLLLYLEKGQLPWQHKKWPLGKSSQFKPDKLSAKTFPMLNKLIDIAIKEKQPDRVLFWYDQSLKNNRNWISIGDDRIAVAIEEHAPERAVAIWQTIAEGLINQTKPSAYEQAVRYLRKAEKIMKRCKKLTEWKNYLNDLRNRHVRKKRLIEILDLSDSKPIIG